MGQTFSAPALQKGIMATIVRRAAETPSIYVPRLFEVVQSDGKSETHENLDDVPQVSLFEGQRKTKALTGRSHEVANEIFDGALLFDRDDLRRNRSGSYMRRIDQLINRVVGFPDKKAIELMTDGINTTKTCYDGGAMFSDTHSAMGSAASQDNLLAGAGTTVANIQTDLQKILTFFGTVTDQGGEPFHGSGMLNLIVSCPKAIEVNMRSALQAAVVSNNSNVLLGVADVIPDGRLDGTDANDWYAFVDDPTARPFILQVEKDWEDDFLGEGTELYNNQRQVQFGVSGSYAYHYLYWQSACKMVNT